MAASTFKSGKNSYVVQSTLSKKRKSKKSKKKVVKSRKTT